MSEAAATLPWSAPKVPAPAVKAPLALGEAEKRHWDERWGAVIEAKNGYRLACWFLATGMIVAGVGNLYQMARPLPPGKIVYVDMSGRVLATSTGTEKPSTLATPQIIETRLEDWINEARSVSSDDAVRRKLFGRVFDSVGSGSPADLFLNAYYRKDGLDPGIRAQKETVEVQVDPVLARSDKTFEVEWMEIVRALDGTKQSEDRYRAIITVALGQPGENMANPLGIYIREVSWAKVGKK